MGGAIKNERLRCLICVPSLDELGYLENVLSESANLIFMVTNQRVQWALAKLGFENIHFLQANEELIEMPPVDRVIVLESDLTTTHFLIKVSLSSVKAPLLVVARNKSIPEQLYTLLGAKIVLHSNTQNIRFLLN
ncbi:hypothetical protein [Planococcus alpniumensis]|uniref:hypothetical protein n=1 Tax=Planococcus alpniumensis TaxID=2708345 RepID=UPI001B8A8E80|nr:hypothetical protein [Planococcus sp. MSAK28401]